VKKERKEAGQMYLNFNSAYPYEGPPVVHQLIPGSLCCKTDTMLGPDKDENSAEGATKYKLAAQFNYTEPGVLVSQPADLTGAGLRLSPAMLGPQLVPDVLSCTARLTDKGLSRQNTGEDVLQSSTLGDYERKFSKSPQIQTLISPSGSLTRPALGAGLGFNYESSSSEISAPKVQTDRRSDDEEPQGRAKYRVRERTDSFRDLKDKARLEIYREQITVPYIMWKYIKEVYQPRFIEVTMAIKVEEQHTDARDATTVFLTSLDPSSVRACQKDLQNIVAKVTADFSQFDLSWTELGISDQGDEILHVFFDEVKSRFKKVSISTSNRVISILGPEHLCSQVASALREEFSVDQFRYLDNKSASRGKPLL
jgi:hypothetical protein